jgi:hypothetical protein
MSVATPSIPLSERINLRVLVFIGIFAFLLGVPIYLALDTMMSGGVKNRGNFFEVDLKAMSDIPFDQDNGQVEDIPLRWRELDGKVVELTGEMAPGTLSASGIDGKFDLVYSVSKCCMTGAPQIQHFIKVTVPPTAKADFSFDKVVVRGKLKVDVTRDPETRKINGVYHVTAEEVTPESF